MLRKQGGFDDSDVVDFDALLMFHSVCAMEGESSTPPRSMKSPALQGVEGEGYASTI
jgi:hypothetical protein